MDDPKRLVQQATDLVALIGEHIALKAKGREMVGLCPFHDDHSPSMQVSPAKQIYKCFSCGAGGDAFSFVMNYHKMTFPEALKYLAERAGIKLSDYRPAGGGFGGGSGGGSVDRQKLAEVNERAMKFYRSMLEHPEFGREARAYLQKRGISDEMAEAFGLGYAPDRWDALAVRAAERGLAMGDLQAAGLVQPRQQGGGHYDRFRHRLMFPILDSLGRAIAFGGRKMREEDEPKYLNSPETPLFNKSATLYGLHRAKKPIIDAKTAVIVEGYTDVIACHQAGVCNVVATLGTALTREHLRELRRFAEKVVLIFDADAAGQKAADRAVEIFLGQEIDVAVAVLPTAPGSEGAKMDPAELFGLAEGRELWRKAMEEAVDALTYQFERFRQQFQGSGTLTGRQKLAEGYLQNLARLGWSGISPIRRGMIVQLVAELLGMGERDVAAALTRYAAAQPRAMVYAAAGETSGGSGASVGAQHNMTAEIDTPLDERTIRRLQTAERQMVGCLLRQPELFHTPLWDGRSLDEALTPGDMVTSAGRQLYQALYDLLAEGVQPSLAEFLADLASVGRQELANLATLGESEVEQLVLQSQTELANLLGELARVILSHHQEEAYDRKRSALLPPGSGGSADAGAAADGAEQTKLAHELLEHQRNNPSPLRHPWRRRLNTPPTT